MRRHVHVCRFSGHSVVSCLVARVVTYSYHFRRILVKDLFVSIIIITRNRASLLRHCIEHVLSQPYPYKEIIVVDSSSNDESEQVVAQFPQVISVRLRGQRNNRPQAYNEGIAASSGNIIAFVDDDAMVQPGWLESLIEAYHDEKIGG